MATSPKRRTKSAPAGAPAKLVARAGQPRDYSVAGALMSEMPLWARPGYLLRRLHQIHYALFFEECTPFDITPVQYGLLTTLATNPDLDQNSIARELGIDRTNAADVLNRLSRRGLIERRRGKVDKRTMLARLTPEGKRVTKEMYAAMQRAQERLLEPLLPAERHAFITTLIRLIDGNNHLGRTIFSPSKA
ncbi:MarR family winged helix-turn-helix transcriptional regulator [Pseudolabrys taiwanensis]|nr:MarR family transcriptional regulator [Pseudolabrys taiwanensis]